MANWSSSSSAASHALTDRQQAILDALRAPGEHTASQLTSTLGFPVEGEHLLAIQVKVLEARNGERVRRRRDGRFVRWKLEQTDS